MKRLQPAIIAYRVSWSPDIVYADVAIERNDADVKFFGRYDFTGSSAMKYKNTYTIAINGMYRYPKKAKMDAPGQAGNDGSGSVKDVENSERRLYYV